MMENVSVVILNALIWKRSHIINIIINQYYVYKMCYII